MKRSVSGPFHRKKATAGPGADGLAVEILTFLAADGARLDRFMAITGLEVAELRQATKGAGFAESILDYLTADEPLLIAFATERDYDPAMIETVRMSLARHFDQP